METRKAYKSVILHTISNLTIVSMIPGYRKVAGCFNSIQVPDVTLFKGYIRFPIHSWRFI